MCVYQISLFERKLWKEYPLGHIPLAKKRQKYDPGILSALVYPESLAILHRVSACSLAEKGSLSPPDHFEYHILYVWPVCFGA